MHTCTASKLVVNRRYDGILQSAHSKLPPRGHARYRSQTPPPDPARIPDEDILGATVVMVTCSYKGAEFVRVGYWVANSYTEPLAEGGGSWPSALLLLLLLLLLLPRRLLLEHPGNSL